MPETPIAKNGRPNQGEANLMLVLGFSSVEDAGAWSPGSALSSF
jgi:hypothetical protein